MYRIGKQLANGSLCDIYEALTVEDELAATTTTSAHSDEEFDFTDSDDQEAQWSMQPQSQQLQAEKEYSPPILQKKSKYEKAVNVGTYVVKIMRNSHNSEQLYREFDIMNSISHPNIIKPKTISYFEDRGLGIVMPCLRGGDLKALLDEISIMKNFSITLSRSICRCLVAAVNYLHENQIFHGDIKIDNLLIDYDQTLNIAGINEHHPVIKLCDFGYSQRIAQPVNELSEKVKIIKGSLPYVTYEMATGQPANPYAVDVWAMGVTLACIVLQVMLFTSKGMKGMVDRKDFTEMMFNEFKEDRGAERQWWREKIFKSVRDHQPTSRRFEKLLRACFRLDERRRATAKEVKNMSWMNSSPT